EFIEIRKSIRKTTPNIIALINEIENLISEAKSLIPKAEVELHLQRYDNVKKLINEIESILAEINEKLEELKEDM
ncbi:MAG: hypothetical protein DRO15_01920, partial [Thermoprotei archaeon]